MAIGRRMTAEEYLVQEFDDVRSELVEGEVVVHDRLNLHQVVVLDLLRGLMRGSPSSPGAGRLDSARRQARRAQRLRPRPHVVRRGSRSRSSRHAPVPDCRPRRRGALAVDLAYDIGAKKAAYERGGLAELWLVDTAADEVLVFRRSSPTAAAFDVSLELTVEDELTSPLLPGFTVSLRRLFYA